MTGKHDANRRFAPVEDRRAIVAAMRSDLTLDGLSVVLPCFDEEPNVSAAVEAASRAAGAVAARHEVIVVDDGSRDGTRALAGAAAAADPHVRLVVHDVNRGYGAAVRSGIAASRMPWVLLTDADGQFDFSALPEFAALAGTHDLVAGYRVDRQDSAPRRAAAGAWNLLMRRTFGVALRDVDCAFKLVRGDAVRALPLQSEGAMLPTELIVRGAQAGWRIAERPVTHLPRTAGEATGGDLGVVLRAFGERRALARSLRADAAPAARGDAALV